MCGTTGNNMMYACVKFAVSELHGVWEAGSKQAMQEVGHDDTKSVCKKKLTAAMDRDKSGDSKAQVDTSHPTNTYRYQGRWKGNEMRNVRKLRNVQNVRNLKCLILLLPRKPVHLAGQSNAKGQFPLSEKITNRTSLKIWKSLSTYNHLGWKESALQKWIEMAENCWEQEQEAEGSLLSYFSTNQKGISRTSARHGLVDIF